MENSGGIQASLSGRYAVALFELARDGKMLDSVGNSVETLRSLVKQSSDFRAFIKSPLVSREDAKRTVKAVGESVSLDPITLSFLGVLAENRRLAELPAMVRAFETLVANHRGETTAEVVSAHELSPEQREQLAAKLKARVGRDVAIRTKVDPEILGGIIVKMGSQMIDGSIRTRLNSLAHAMKG